MKTKKKKTSGTQIKFPKVKKIILAGLGNPGDEYKDTVHNVGRMAVSFVAKQNGADFKENGAIQAEVAKGKISKKGALFILPNTFMNNSGKAVVKLVKKSELDNLVVIHDDLDLPLGKVKISFNRGSGGHRGVESIIKAFKSEGFIRMRVGVSKPAKKGGVKKPDGDEAVAKFILRKIKEDEMKELKKVFKAICQKLETLADKGLEAMISQG